MSAFEVPVQTDKLNEIGDSVAALVSCILQEQLAPILETIREHSKLLGLHSALLNHSTKMNNYNVGKLDDIRDLQTNVNYKLQFHIDPEDRKRPTYYNPQPAITQKSSVNVSNSKSAADGDDTPKEHTPVDDTSNGNGADLSNGTSSATGVSDQPSPARQPTPVIEPPKSPTPRPISADGCRATKNRRGLQRERPHDETPDPMWNSSRNICLPQSVPTPLPPPSHVPLPQLASSRSETGEPTANAPPSSLPLVPVCEASTKSADQTYAEATSVAAGANPCHSPASMTPITPQGQTPGDRGLKRGPSVSQLSDKAAGKKRKREDDASSSSGGGGGQALASVNPSSLSASEGGEPACKRMKDGTISTERLPIPESFLRVARSNIFGEPTFDERRSEVEQMRYLKNLFRGGST